jgi:F-type H+-transporting ATPase subunit b
MIRTLLFLAEAHAEVESGFGFKLDILESNLINLIILIGVLFYYGSKVVGNILNERKTKIAQRIQEVEQEQKQAAATLAEEQQKLAQAQATAKNIVQEAETNGQKAKEAILAKGQQEVERLKATAAQDLQSEQEKAIAELRQRVAALAVERAESRLQEMLNEEAQQTLIDRSISQLGGSR